MWNTLRLDTLNHDHDKIGGQYLWKGFAIKTKFKWLIVATSALIISFGGLAALDNYREVKRTQDHIQQLESEYQRLESEKQELQQQTEQKQKQFKKEIDQKTEQEKKLREEIERLKVAKAERERKRLALLASETASAAPSRSFGGNCDSWIAAAGISDVASARELIGRESGCDPYARNGSSGACGVAQELPCGKSGCSLGDGACQVKWMNGYVIGRYGSWAAAVAFHNVNNWY